MRSSGAFHVAVADSMWMCAAASTGLLVPRKMCTEPGKGENAHSWMTSLLAQYGTNDERSTRSTAINITDVLSP